MVFRRPGKVVFAQADFEVAFSGEDVHGQAPVPECDAEFQHRLAFQIDFAAMDGNFENTVKGGFGDGLRIKKAEASFFYSEFLQVAAHELRDDVYFLSCANGDAEF